MRATPNLINAQLKDGTAVKYYFCADWHSCALNLVRHIINVSALKRLY